MSNGSRLRDRVAVVTGASGGIGRAVALAFSEAGADVVVHYHRSREAAEEVAERVGAAGRDAVVVQGDVSRGEDVERIRRAALDRFGRVDVWTNIAGYDIITGAAAELPDEEKLDRLSAVDLRGTILCSWAAADAMADRGGAIINMSWNRALSGMAGRPAELFAAVKGGILSFSRSLALTVAPRIRVHVLAPGWIRTEYYETLDEEQRRGIEERIPLGRWGTPEDVARATVFLASDEAGYMTGQALLVGGGEVI